MFYALQFIYNNHLDKCLTRKKNKMSNLIKNDQFRNHLYNTQKSAQTNKLLRFHIRHLQPNTDKVLQTNCVNISNYKLSIEEQSVLLFFFYFARRFYYENFLGNIKLSEYFSTNDNNLPSGMIKHTHNHTSLHTRVHKTNVITTSIRLLKVPEPTWTNLYKNNPHQNNNITIQEGKVIKSRQINK